MTALPPDRDPLNNAGGMLPDGTAPTSARTSTTAMPERAAGRKPIPRAVVMFLAVALFIVVFVATAVYLGVQIFT